MITTGKSIYDLLSADTSIAAAVGAKIYPLVAPEGTNLPFIIYERSYNNNYTKDGR